MSTATPTPKLIINFTTKLGHKYLYLPVDETTANKFVRYAQLCGSCEWARIERTALHVEVLDLLHSQPTLFQEIPKEINVVGWPYVQVIDHSV
jgi:hypothetical protein